MFRVGQKVVCVDASSRQGYSWHDDAPIEGAVYTVSGNFVGADGTPIIHLIELRRSAEAVFWYGPETGYRASRFRPIVDRKTDISVFQEILRKVSSPSPFDAEVGVG